MWQTYPRTKGSALRRKPSRTASSAFSIKARVRAEALSQASPSLLDSGEVLLAIQHSMIDAPSQPETEETRPAGLRVRKLVRVFEVHAPQAIGSATTKGEW